jgi:short-subunit dehydrogenase
VNLDGKTLLLTGATGGIGNAIAAALAEKGARLVLSSRKEDRLRQLADSLPSGNGNGNEHRVIRSDLAEPGAAQKLIADAGEIDGLVANAALPASGRLERFSPEEIERALRVNLSSPILMARELLPGFKERGDGHLLFIASLAGVYASARSSLYSATKFGLRGFAQGLREDLAGSGVGVSLVSPGLVREAGLFADSGAKAPPGLGTSSPRDVARAVVKAIERNSGEIFVSPIQQRLLARFAGLQPELVGKITRRPVAQKVADSVAAGQTDKR